MNREDLQLQYAGLSTNELLEIVDRKFDYTELAVTVASEEINKRKISEEDIKEYKDDQVFKAMTYIRKNISDDLGLFQKILFFFVWLPIINFPFKQNFRDGNFVLKLKQANYYSLLGFVFMMSVGLISGFVDMSNLTAFTVWFLSFIPAYAFDEFFNRKRLIQRLRVLLGMQDETDG